MNVHQPLVVATRLGTAHCPPPRCSGCCTAQSHRLAHMPLGPPWAPQPLLCAGLRKGQAWVCFGDSAQALPVPLFLAPRKLVPDLGPLTPSPGSPPSSGGLLLHHRLTGWSSAAGVPPWSRPWGAGATVRPSGGVLGTAVRGMPQGGRPLCLLRGDWCGEKRHDPRTGEGGCRVGSPRCPKSPSQCHPGIPHRAKHVCLPLPLSQPESVCPSRKDPGWEGSRPCIPVHPGDCQASQGL